MDSRQITGDEAGAAVRSTSLITRIFRTLREAPALPLFLFALMVFLAIFGDVVTPHDPIKINMTKRLRPPWGFERGSREHIFGTDQLGRDILSRVISGARVSLIVAVTAVAIAGTIGTTLALLAGYLGGWVDMIISRVVDTMFSLPYLLIAIVLAGVVGPSLRNIILILGITMWAGYARVLRGQVLQLKEIDFTKLAIVSGSSRARIMIKHIFPNIINTLTVLATLQVGTAIIAESSLSFLGLGVPPPHPAWGSILSDGRPYISIAWWLCLFPGIALSLTVLSGNLLGDWLALKLDPRFRQRGQ